MTEKQTRNRLFYACEAPECLYSGYKYQMRNHYLSKHCPLVELPFHCMECDFCTDTRKKADNHQEKLHSSMPFEEVFRGTFTEAATIPMRPISPEEHEKLMSVFQAKPAGHTLEELKNLYQKTSTPTVKPANSDKDSEGTKCPRLVFKGLTSPTPSCSLEDYGLGDISSDSLEQESIPEADVDKEVDVEDSKVSIQVEFSKDSPHRVTFKDPEEEIPVLNLHPPPPSFDVLAEALWALNKILETLVRRDQTNEDYLQCIARALEKLAPPLHHLLHLLQPLPQLLVQLLLQESPAQAPRTPASVHFYPPPRQVLAIPGPQPRLGPVLSAVKVLITNVDDDAFE